MFGKEEYMGYPILSIKEQRRTNLEAHSPPEHTPSMGSSMQWQYQPGSSLFQMEKQSKFQMTFFLCTLYLLPMFTSVLENRNKDLLFERALFVLFK